MIVVYFSLFLTIHNHLTTSCIVV